MVEGALGRPTHADGGPIGECGARVANKYKVAKHVERQIPNGGHHRPGNGFSRDASTWMPPAATSSSVE
jgi:hypothetical protein